MTIDYGFDTTDSIQLDKPGLPVGTFKVLIVGEEPEKEGRGLIAEYEILEGEFKGKTGKEWFLTKHENPQTSNIAKQRLRRIADATGMAISAQSPLKNRELTIVVRQQKKNPDYAEVASYHPFDWKPPIKDEIPFA